MIHAKDYALYSGERYPYIDIDKIGGDHLARYRYVIDRMRDRAGSLYGADVFCGSGYGTLMMAEGLNASILAIDGSAEAIERASTQVVHSSVLFCSKLFPFQLPTETFDFVTSMESIEHVRDHSAFFDVLARSLKRGGRLFISAPNERVMPLGDYKWHYKHFTPEEIESLGHAAGLQLIAGWSTKSHELECGKSKLFYPYQIQNGRLLDLAVGDTMFMEFSKP